MRLHLQDFGAVGDGKAMDTGALQAAIDAAAVRGGTVVVEGGTFKIGSVMLRSNVSCISQRTGCCWGRRIRRITGILRS